MQKYISFPVLRSQRRLWLQPPSLIEKETEYEKGWAWGQARPTQKPAHQ